MKKKMKDVREGPVNYDLGESEVLCHCCRVPKLHCYVALDKLIGDVHAYKVNPNEPTAEDLDVSWPEVVDRRLQ